MLLRLERVEAQHGVTVLDATETFAISKDAADNEPDPDGTNPIMTTNGGTAFISLVPRGQLNGWLNHAGRQLGVKTGGPPIVSVLDLAVSGSSDTD